MFIPVSLFSLSFLKTYKGTEIGNSNSLYYIVHFRHCLQVGNFIFPSFYRKSLKNVELSILNFQFIAKMFCASTKNHVQIFYWTHFVPLQYLLFIFFELWFCFLAFVLALGRLFSLYLLEMTLFVCSGILVEMLQSKISQRRLILPYPVSLVHNNLNRKSQFTTYNK